MIISVNIGYSGPLGSGILTTFPQTFDQFKTFNEFKQMVKGSEDIETFWEWAKVDHIPPSHLCLFIRVDDGDEYWEFKVHLINVKEYRDKWEKQYGPWKHNTKDWSIKD